MKRRLSIGRGAGALAVGRLPADLGGRARGAHGVPLIITSHTNETGQNAMREAWKILDAGGSALDAVEKGANVIEGILA